MISSVIGSPRVRVDLATQPYRGFADDHREAARPLQRNGKRAVGRLRYPGVTPPLGTRPRRPFHGELDWGRSDAGKPAAINGSETARPATQHGCTTPLPRRSSVQLTNSFGSSRHRMRVWSDGAELTLALLFGPRGHIRSRFCRAGEESTGNCGPVLFERSMRAARTAPFVRRRVLPRPARFAGQTARARRVASR